MKTLKFISIGILFCLANAMVAQIDNITIGDKNQDTDSLNQTKLSQQPETVISQTVTPVSTSASIPVQVTLQTEENNKPAFRSGELGIRYMPTFSVLRYINSAGGEVKGEVVMGNGFGALLAVNSKHLGVQLEAIYSATAQKFKDNGREHKVTFNYINIPLLLTLNTNKAMPVNLNIAVGPQLGINVGTTINTTGTAEVNGGTTTEPVVSARKSDFGFAYGAGLEFALNPSHTIHFGLGFRGVYGLIDIRDNSKTIATDQYFILARTNMQNYSGYVGLSVLF